MVTIAEIKEIISLPDKISASQIDATITLKEKKANLLVNSLIQRLW